MNRLEMILTAILTFSMVLNIGLIIYVRGAIIRLLSVSEELGDLQQMINSFAIHLKNVYELEMFYGDETLSSLLDHGKGLMEELENLESIFDHPDDIEQPEQEIPYAEEKKEEKK